ncbi:hypothetical protein HPULCUR_006108 [Helicostylum pulchrum]|uniref:Serine/threonine-protein phosphatase 1 regulatory subunit 10 n=1 Tax=Helicostylum pulchrum TaxID=562976 RepID=A0ABP9Y0Z4_9FUNG
MIHKREHVGLISLTEYQKLSEQVENVESFPIDYVDIFLKTKDKSLLTEIGKSRFLAKRLKEVIAKITDPWQPESILQILKLLKHIPFELSNLVDNDLGHAIKNIKKIAISKNHKQITDETTNLIKEWKELQTKQVQLSGKRDSPERSSSTSPPTEHKKVRLAIQKEPPARPKAMADMNFFAPSVSTEPKRFRIVRPVYSVDPTTTVKEENSSPLIKSASPTKKTVRFAEKLVEIREYEKNPEEWTNFDDCDETELSVYDDSEQTPYYNIPTVDWYHPLELNFNTEQNPSLIIPKHVRTIESAAQDTREKTVLAAIYTSAQHIPSSPGEPGEFPDPNIDTRVIPLEDVNSQPTYNNNNISSSSSSSNNNIVAPTPTPQTIHPEMITPATLSAAAAIAAAMDTSYSSSPQQIHRVPTPAPPPAPVVQAPIINSVQPEISNHTVEAMLRNNPGIMQSLKKLSFLAAGNTGTMPQTMSYNQPQIYGGNVINRNGRPPAKITKNRGGNRNRGGGGPNRNFSNRVCNFFASNEGCRNGANCPFSHEK